MISKSVKAFCSEDPSLIENYELAINDKTQTWHCHHRKETDEGLSRAELKAMGLYYNRPASELIFLTKDEHTSLHHKGKKHHLGKRHSQEARAKIGVSRKGKKTGEKHPRARAVYQIDKNTGAIIKQWNCINEAGKSLGICGAGISICCAYKIKSAYGYIWRYVDVH